MDLTHAACYRAIATRDARFDGRLFIGVKTTGIYCRPVCPARTPRRENVVFFPSAAAAQAAGFRPCLRCRPETAPEFAAWRGTSNTVSRALALIEAGALDEREVESLAGRVGVGERQLRRLFRTHLGASPIAVAQTRRVLLAKQLIHETRLPMAEVALASGFGSIRRFNETFHVLFGRAPGALRRSGAEDVASGPTGAVTLRLRYRPPYDWPAVLAFLQARAIPGLEVASSSGYARAIEIGGVQGVVSVCPARPARPTSNPAGRTSSDDVLEVTVRFPALSALPGIIARLRRVFDLAADPLAIGAQLSEDPLLARLVAKRPGLRVPGAWDGFELAVRAVLGQQITVGAAVGLAARLVERHGAPLSARHEGFQGLTRVFPTPQRLASADLAVLGMPKARAAALSSLAAAVVANPRILNATGDLEETVRRLRDLPGIGEWTAQYIAMRALREPDAFPAADSGLLRAMAGRTGRRPAPGELLVRAEAWRPWRAYAAQHLWASDAIAPSRPAPPASRCMHTGHPRSQPRCS